MIIPVLKRTDNPVPMSIDSCLLSSFLNKNNEPKILDRAATTKIKAIKGKLLKSEFRLVSSPIDKKKNGANKP